MKLTTRSALHIMVSATMTCAARPRSLPETAKDAHGASHHSRELP